MRLRRNRTTLVTIIDGTVLRGRATLSWRWRVARLINVHIVTQAGRVPAAGPVLIPYRSIIVAQEVEDE